MEGLAAESLVIHHKQKYEVLECIGDCYMRTFFSEYEEIERVVLNQKAKDTKYPKGATKSQLTPKQKSQAQIQTQIQARQQMNQQTNTSTNTALVDHDFIQDLKQRVDFTRDEELQSAFKHYLEARRTLLDAKLTIDPKLHDLKDVANAFLRTY